MKIAHVITRSDEIGGAQVHIKDLTKTLEKLGHENIVIAGGSGIFFDTLSNINIKHISLQHLVRPISLVSDIKAVFELKNTLKEINPDIVTIHSFKAGLIARLACLLLKKKCIFTAHGWSFIRCAGPLMKFIYILIERSLSLVSFKVITVCNDDKHFALERRIATNQKLAMIYNGTPDIEESLIAKHENAAPKIIMVARFDWPKDHMILVNALGELRDLPWCLNFVGDGPYIDEIKSKVKESELNDRIKFLGRREDIAELLCQSDIFVLTSHAEGFPISIIEAMRASLPVVATNIGGIAEAVIDGKTGFVVADNNQDELKRKLLTLISNKDIVTSMGALARERYLNFFTCTKMVDETLAIYEETISSR